MFPALCSSPVLTFLWRSEWRTNFKNSPGENGHGSLTIRHTDLCLVPNESSHQALSNGDNNVYVYVTSKSGGQEVFDVKNSL